MIISRKGQRWIEHIIKMEVTFYDREIYSVIKGVFLHVYTMFSQHRCIFCRNMSYEKVCFVVPIVI